MDCSLFFYSKWINEWLWLNGYLAFDKFLNMRFCDIFIYMWLHAQWFCVLFRPPLIIFECWHIFLALLNLYLRDPSLERKASFFLKVVLLLLLGFTSYNLSTFWVLTNWRRCRGTKVHICPGRTTKIERDFCGQIGISKRKEGCVFSLVTSLWNCFRVQEQHSGFQKTHTR